MDSTILFNLVTVFSNDAFKGNPAAVVFMDVTLHEDGIYQGIARNLNQPMAAFVAPRTTVVPGNPQVAGFDIRYFTASNFEVPLCGHATLAAAHVIFSESRLVSSHVDILEFSTRNSGTIKAQRQEDGSLQIRFPSCVPEQVSSEESARLVPYLNKAFGREIVTHYIGKGGAGGNYRDYVMVEIDAKEDLKSSVVDTESLRGTGYSVHVITSISNTGQELFISRMFTPLVPGGEDMVCGTAHCLIGPYWYTKCCIRGGNEIRALQVSPRGGELMLTWLEDEDAMILRGFLAIIARGELHV